MIVAGTRCGSVVAKMNIANAGGSSSVFKSALNAAGESMWTSSKIYTRRLPTVGGYMTLSKRSRICSTRLLDAASNSKMSAAFASDSARQARHSPHGSPSCGFSQLTARARILAVLVLPVPRGPQKR